jgi:hypothetical protein
MPWQTLGRVLPICDPFSTGKFACAQRYKPLKFITEAEYRRGQTVPSISAGRRARALTVSHCSLTRSTGVRSRGTGNARGACARCVAQRRDRCAVHDPACRVCAALVPAAVRSGDNKMYDEFKR